MTKQYLILATKSQIAAVNPDTRRVLQILRGEFLDLHACKSGIFHAEERKIHHKKKDTKGNWHTYPSNHAVIIDTLSGNTVRTAYPPGQLELPFETRYKPLEFSFDRQGDSLVARINGTEQVLFDRINIEETICEESIKIEGRKAYLGRKKAATMASPISYARLVDAKAFEKQAKRKNMTLYHKVRDYLRKAA